MIELHFICNGARLCCTAHLERLRLRNQLGKRIVPKKLQGGLTQTVGRAVYSSSRYHPLNTLLGVAYISNSSSGFTSGQTHCTPKSVSTSRPRFPRQHYRSFKEKKKTGEWSIRRRPSPRQVR